MDKVCILLSSYNGEKYIKQQLDSIFAQEDVEIELVIRDDGSSDRTREIIKEYGRDIQLIEAENVGCEKSFAELLKHYSDADYYAYCDQDDYWLPTKLIKEIEAIRNVDGPAIAGCNLMICDSDLNPKEVMHSEQSLEITPLVMKRNYLGNMHGCVLLWNKELQSLLSKRVPKQMISHDGWVNMVANAIGTMKIVKEPLIYYRIHNNNVAGHAENKFQRIKKGLTRYLGKKHPQRDRIAKDLLEQFGEYLNKEEYGYETIVALACYKDSFSNKIRLINKDIIKNSKYPDKLLWIVCVLLGTY